MDQLNVKEFEIETDIILSFLYEKIEKISDFLKPQWNMDYNYDDGVLLFAIIQHPHEDSADVLQETEYQEDKNYQENSNENNVEEDKEEAYQMYSFLINKNTPSGKIWYSSPVSKPKYYEFDIESRKWLESTEKTDIVKDTLKDINLIQAFNNEIVF